MTRTMEPIAEWTVWDPVAGRSSTRITPRMMTIHTAVTNSQDIYGPGLGPGRTHSHFYNPKSGTLRQHQEINKQAFADGGGNSYCVSVEHWDGYPNGAPGYWRHGSDVPPLTDSQIENDARLFAHLVTHFGMPNRIATPDNLTGLGWHRLGVQGNFGTYNPRDRKTWSRAQTGANFSNATGKVCPGDRRIDQIQAIWDRAQEYLRAGTSKPATVPASGSSSASAPVAPPTKPTPTPALPTLEGIEKVVQYMKATHIIFEFQEGRGTALAIANVLAGTWTRFGSTDDYKARLTVLKRSGAKVEEWKTFKTGKNPNNIASPAAFGVEVKA